MIELAVARPIALRHGLGRVHEPVPGASSKAQAYYDQGLAYLHSYAYIDAARSLNQALRIDSGIALAHVALSRAYLGLEQPAAAGRALARAQALAMSADARTRRRVRILEARLAALAAPSDVVRLAAYRQAIEEAIAQELDSPELWTLRGNAEEPFTGAAGIGQFGGAASVAYYERAIALQPDHPGAHHYLVHSYESLGRTDSALAHGRVYARLVPGIAHAQHMYAHDLMRVDQIPAAIRQFEVADSIERAYYAADDIAPVLDWHRPHNLELLALLYLHQGRLRDAEGLLGEVRALPPTGAFGFAYLRTLPELQIVRGRAAEAEPLLGVLTGDSVPGARVLGHSLRARARLSLGRVTDARADLAVAEEDFARTGPFEAAILRPYVDLTRGAVALRDGRAADADSLLRAATAAAGALPGPDGWVSALLAYDGALDVARRAGNWGLVERLARALVAHAPSYAPGHRALALAAEQRGDPVAARQSLTRALTLWKDADADLPERLDAVRQMGAASSAPRREGYLEGAGGARLFYRVEGAGTDTIVVLHGGPGSSHQYLRAHLGPLAARHVIVYFDQRGGGRSTLYADTAKLAFRHFVADLEAVRRHFKLERMTLLGHSWGGILGPLYALAFPARVERLVLIAPQAPAKDPFLDEGNREVGRRIATRLDSATLARVDSLQRAMATTDDPAAVCRAIGPLIARAFMTTPPESVNPADFCDGTPEAIRGSAVTGQTADRSLGDYDLRPRVQPLRRIPTLIIGGTDDPYRTSAEAWAATLPTARLVMFPGAGHNPQIDRPEDFHRAVADFLDRGGPVRRR